MIEVRPGGSGDEGDAALVQAQLDLLPAGELQMLRTNGIGVIACRDAVTDYRHDLAGDAPRNWPPGVDWTVVPGCYAPDEKNVIIATLADPAGGRRIPPKGVKHGSWNLVLHEVMHADDYSADRKRCHNRAFLAARTTDLQRLGDYERRDGQAGYEETYAESAARHFGRDPSLAGHWPALHAFWSGAQPPIEPGRRRRTRGAEPTPIGTATLLEDDSIELDLTAVSDTGVTGHALVQLSPGTEAHRAVRIRFGSGRRARSGQPDTLLLAPFERPVEDD